MSTAPNPLPSEDGSSTNEDVIPPARDALVTGITPQDSTKGTAYYLGRRLRLALHDLGLLQHVTSGWVQVSRGGLSFASLSVSEADKLVLVLEDLAQCRPTTRGPRVSPDQLRLF
jgi:hypothetical protein